jgi:hypothetical protein
MTSTPYFRQLIGNLRDEESWQALTAHLRSAIAEGICPMCNGNLVPDEQTGAECTGPNCLHGFCPSCAHSSHYDPDIAPETSEGLDLPQLQAVMLLVLDAVDAGCTVRARPRRRLS